MKNINATTSVSAKQSPQRLAFFQGVRSGLPIALGYLPIAIAFGLLANSAGVPGFASIFMSFLVYAGASQFVSVNLLALGVSHAEIVLTTFILNLRHFLMTASISRRIPDGTSKSWLALLAYGITDETFSVASMQEEPKLAPHYLLGLNLTSFGAWVFGTAVGVFVGAALPASLQNAMGIALYTMFIGLLIPSVRKSIPVAVIALSAAVTHSVLQWVPFFDGLSTGWNIVISTIAAAGLGTVLFPQEVDAE